MLITTHVWMWNKLCHICDSAINYWGRPVTLIDYLYCQPKEKRSQYPKQEVTVLCQ